MHEYWEDRLPYYVAGTLPPDERSALERHLRTCLLCQDKLHEWQLITHAVRAEASSRVSFLPPLKRVYPSRNGWHKPENSSVEEHIVTTFELTRGLELRRNTTSSRTLSFFTLAAAAVIVIVFAALIITPGGSHKNTGEDPSSAGLAAQATATLPPTNTPLPSTALPTQPPADSPVSQVTATPFAITLEPQRYVEHTVVAGEDCLSIAVMYGNTDPSVIELIETFNEVDCDALPVGAKIWVPVSFSPAPDFATPTALPVLPLNANEGFLEYLVQPGDDCLDVLAAYSQNQPWVDWSLMSVIEQTNQVSCLYPLTPGSVILIPGGTSAAGAYLEATATPIPWPENPNEPMNTTVEAAPVPANAAPPTPVAGPVTLNISQDGDTTRLEGIRYEQQGWNNQGPTALTMALSYYGWDQKQDVAAQWLKPNIEDKSVNPWQMTYYVNTYTGNNALYRMGGTVDLLKSLVEAGFPVIAAVGLDSSEDEWLGHYQVLMGRDDDNVLVYDSYLGSNDDQGRPYADADFDAAWRQFNRTFIVIYEPGREKDLRTILGEYVDPWYGYNAALEQSRDEIAENAEDQWAWFNQGTALGVLGDVQEAAAAYDKALELGLPYRLLWYQFGPFEAYYQLGRYDDVIALADSVLDDTIYIEEIHYWKGMALVQQGKFDAALESFQTALQMNANYFPAQQAIQLIEWGIALPDGIEPLD
ncbi:MAG TPA: tetratricopeptide repeat protein [Aggregatilineaceae bacterium]|nr:tetratricopeptide repeat protein [Aggregatilineaceae bacterium]